MRKLVVAASIVALGLAACQTDQPTTASGSPEVTIPGVKPERAKPQLLNAAMNNGMKLKSDTAYQLTFERPWGGTVSSAVIGALISTNASSVVERLTFSIAEAPGGTRIVLDRYMVKTGSFGREDVNPANNAPGLDNLQATLEKVSAGIRG